MATVKSYNEKRDSKSLFDMMQREDDWTDYSGDDTAIKKYKIALAESVTYVLYDDDTCCGFIRARDDFGFNIFIHDLLVCKTHRGKSYGKMLIEQLCKDFAGTIFVMSDADEYYRKQGYTEIEGHIVIIKK